MVPQSILYLGELRSRATHGPSKVELVTDAPVDNFGRGESFSPTDLVVTALATCQMTTMDLMARRDQIILEGTKVYAEKHMSTEPPRRVARVVIRMEFPSGIPHDYRPRLEIIATTCPVARTIHPDVKLDITFSYPD